MNKTQVMMIESFSNVLDKYPFTDRKKKSYNIKDLFQVELSQSQSIQVGKKIEFFINEVLHKTPNVKCHTTESIWIDTETNRIQIGGNSKGLKDVDILFEYNKKSYYLELKSNLDLDTEKVIATTNKVKLITDSLNKNGGYGEVESKILSPFWYKNSSIANPFPDDKVMWISELFKIVGITLPKNEYNEVCIEIGKDITKRLNSKVNLEDFME
tara:strand:+ start:568 stop:1206 length:639 start_codon:yes stop_codon:yes gene_type:complete